ncbi:hypothetical protein ES703_17305 [subsurface metagenome]
MMEKKQKQVRPTGKKVKESLSYTVEVRDKEGRIIKRVSAPSRSYVQQWNQFLNVLAAHGDSKTIKDTAGVNQTVAISAWYYALQMNGAIAGINFGIRVGTGNTPVAIDDYALESPCGEGAGTDEFKHQAVICTAPSVVGPSCSFTLSRIILNISGASISVREIGSYFQNYQSGWFYFLGFRDVLPGAVNIPDGGSIRVTYTVSVTV